MTILYDQAAILIIGSGLFVYLLKLDLRIPALAMGCLTFIFLEWNHRRITSRPEPEPEMIS